MSQTILIETNEDLKKIFTINLSTYVGTDVIHRLNADDALALLKILPQVNLIITKAKIGDEETALKIHNFITSQNLKTNLIVLGSCPQLANEVLCLSEPVSWELLIKQSATYLGVSLQDATKKIRPDFIPVSLHYFYDIKQSPCDIYIRIKKGPNDFQFVKRINSKDQFDRDVIDKYEAQGLQEFFVLKENSQYFTTFVTNNIVGRLERDDLTLEERILTTANGHEIVRDRVQQMELDLACIDLSDASIKSMVKSVKDSPELANLLKFLLSNKVSYAYQHCHLVALISHYILLKQSWYVPEHLHILSFAAFFSDVTLKSPKEIQISTMKELENSSLSEEEKREVANHARNAVSILQYHPEINPHIKTVLTQSHGNLDGVGFEENPGEEIYPLAKVFIIADTFVKILLNPHMPSTKKEILPLLYNRFIHPSYQKIIKALEQKFQ